tara:strand:+ start:1523 stop:2458 length:936 start_codon:yes stop_codon:yes gene_type:complete
MKRYLVTGGAGFIGSNLVRRIIKDGNSVLCVEDLSTGKYNNISKFEEHENFEFINHDLTKPFFPDNIDAIFNLASPASPVSFQFNPVRTLKMGTLAIYNVLGIATRLDIPVLQASTSEIYGDPLEHPQKETYWGNVNPIGKRACYDEGKRVAEALFVSYLQNNKTDIRIARIFNTYGPFLDVNDGRVISNFVNQAIRGEDLTIYGDGSQTRSFCFVDDLVDGLIRLMDSSYNMPVNLGNPEEYTINDIASKIIDLTNSQSNISFKELPSDDPKQRCPDITLAKKLLNWEPKTSLEDGLKRTIDFFEAIANK